MSLGGLRHPNRLACLRRATLGRDTERRDPAIGSRKVDPRAEPRQSANCARPRRQRRQSTIGLRRPACGRDSRCSQTPRPGAGDIAWQRPKGPRPLPSLHAAVKQTRCHTGRTEPRHTGGGPGLYCASAPTGAVIASVRATVTAAPIAAQLVETFMIFIALHLSLSLRSSSTAAVRELRSEARFLRRSTR